MTKKEYLELQKSKREEKQAVKKPHNIIEYLKGEGYEVKSISNKNDLIVVYDTLLKEFDILHIDEVKNRYNVYIACKDYEHGEE